MVEKPLKSRIKIKISTLHCLLNVELNTAVKRWAFCRGNDGVARSLFQATLPFKSDDTPRMNELHICICMLTQAGHRLNCINYKSISLLPVLCRNELKLLGNTN